MEYFHELLNRPDTGIFVMIGFFLIIGALAKWRMFIKCEQPGLAAIVPVWDFIVTMRIVGRPASHALLFLIPVFNIYFAFKILIEIAQSFGKTTVLDYIFAVVFNIFYLLNLSLAFNELYRGPVYGLSMAELKEREATFAPA